MFTHYIFNGFLLFATLTTSLVAGLLLTFWLLIMPGIGRLEDRAFLRTFQVIDGIIQRGQPVFGVIWVGSVVALAATAMLGLWHAGNSGRWLILAATGLYLFVAQLPTMRVMCP